MANDKVEALVAMNIAAIRPELQKAMPDHKVAVWVAVQVVDSEGRSKIVELAPELVEMVGNLIPILVEDLR